jgi:hypothetical protein
MQVDILILPSKWERINCVTRLEWRIANLSPIAERVVNDIPTSVKSFVYFAASDLFSVSLAWRTFISWASLVIPMDTPTLISPMRTFMTQFAVVGISILAAGHLFCVSLGWRTLWASLILSMDTLTSVGPGNLVPKLAFFTLIRSFTDALIRESRLVSLDCFEEWVVAGSVTLEEDK